MLTIADLAQFIQAQGIDAEIVHLTEPTPTVPTAAAAVGAVPEQICKSVLFLVQGEPQLVIGSGLARIDSKALARLHGVGRKQVKLANPEQVLAHTGYPVGTVPPFGHPAPLPTVVEVNVLAQDIVYAGGGGLEALLRLTVAELRRVVGPATAALV